MRNHGDYFLEKEEKRWETASCVRLPPFFRFHTFAVPTKDKIKRRSLFFFLFSEKRKFSVESCDNFSAFFFGGKGGNWGPKIAGNWKEFTFLRYTLAPKLCSDFFPCGWHRLATKIELGVVGAENQTFSSLEKCICRNVYRAIYRGIRNSRALKSCWKEKYFYTCRPH